MSAPGPDPKKEDKKEETTTGTAQRETTSGGAQIPVQQQHAGGSGAGQQEQQRAVSSLDIQLVQSLVERCLQLYMNKREVFSIIEQQAKIEPSFTGLVWQQLEGQNPDFFKAYYGRLRLKDQIVVFNQLIERHYHMLRPNPQSTLQSGGQQPQYGQTGQQPGGGHHQDSQPVSVQEQQRQTPPPPQAQHAYHHQQGGPVVLQGQAQHQQQQARNGVGGSTSTVPATDANPHGDLGSARGGTVQPLRSAAHGEGVLAKESTFNVFNAAGGLSALPSENDGLNGGGLGAFPRIFSLSDLSMDLQQGNDGEQTLNLLSTFHQDGGEAYGLVGPSETNEEEIKRNFSLSDVNLEM